MQFSSVSYLPRLVVFVLAGFLAFQSLAYAKEKLPPEFRAEKTTQQEIPARAENSSDLSTDEVKSAVHSKVNINTADASELEKKLKGIGESKAHAIIEYRTKYGAFKSADDLVMVKGIGAATIEKNRDKIEI